MCPDVLAEEHRNGYAADPYPPASWAFRPDEADSLEPDEATVQRIKRLPKELGVMLISVGVAGFILPGVMGTPALIAGGLVLWPGAFGRLENWFARRKPELHRQGMKQIGRFLDDLERRYPPTASPDEQPG